MFSKKSGKLHAHEVSPDDSALMRALRGAKFSGPVTLPSGKVVDGDEMTQWVADVPDPEVGSGIAEQFNAMRAQAYEKSRAESHARDSRYEMESARLEADHAFMVGQCRPASSGEYSAWLRGYMLTGGEPSHFYQYETPRFWVATTKLLEVRPLYGARSIEILVPEGTADDGGLTGHTSLYIVRGGRYFTRSFHNRAATIPAYADTAL